MGEIEEKISVRGAEEAKQAFDSVAQAQGRVADGVEETGRRAEGASRSAGAFNDILAAGASHAATFAAGLLGGGGLMAALQAIREEAEASQKALSDFVTSMAASQALTRDPRLLEIASRASVESGRPIDVIGAGIFNIASSVSQDPAVIEQLMKEAVELGKAEPEVDLAVIIDLLGRLKKAQPDASFQTLQNFVVASEKAATADLGSLGANLPGVLGVGAGAQVPPEEVSALYAIATGTLNPSVAATASSNIINRLSALSPEGAKVFKRLGISQDGSFAEKLQALASANTRDPLAVADIRALLGEGPGASVLPVVLGQIEQFGALSASIQEATLPGAPDLGAEQLGHLRNFVRGYSENERLSQVKQRREQFLRESGIATEETQAEAILLAMDTAMQREGMNPLSRFTARKTFEANRFIGRDIISSLESAVGPQPAGKLFDERAAFIAEILKDSVPEANISAEDVGPKSLRGTGVYEGPNFRERLSGQGQAPPVNVNIIGTQYLDVEAGRLPEPAPDLNQ